MHAWGKGHAGQWILAVEMEQPVTQVSDVEKGRQAVNGSSQIVQLYFDRLDSPEQGVYS